MRLPVLLTAALLVGACAANPVQDQPRALRAQQELDTYLAGKVAGPAQNCLPTFRSRDMVVIDDNTVLFRDGARYWRTEMQGGCNGLGSKTYALVTRQFGSGDLCRGEIAQVRDLAAGFTVGSCTFGEFVPYSPPPVR